MEFKQPRRKKTSFSNPDPKLVVPTKKLKWFEDDDEWLDLVHKVKNEKSDKKSDTKIKKLFSKKESAFDEPTKTTSKKGVKIVEKTKTKAKKIKKISSTKSLKNKKNIIFVSLPLLVLTGLLLNKFIINDNNVKDVAGTSKKVADKHTFLEPGDTPPYKILYPGGKNAQNIGKIIKNNSPSQNSTYSYVDVVAGVEINVTQQEINELIKNNPEKTLEAAAKANNQNEIISVDGVTVYLGTSAKGPQVASFIKGNLIIFINASDTISNETWAAYISALHS